MNTRPDFEELFRLLEEHDVDYMIVGGYGVNACYPPPRFTTKGTCARGITGVSSGSSIAMCESG